MEGESVPCDGTGGLGNLMGRKDLEVLIQSLPASPVLILFQIGHVSFGAKVRDSHLS